MTHALPLWTISGPKMWSWKWFRHLGMVAMFSLSLIAVGCTATEIEGYINLAAQIALNGLSITSAVRGGPISVHDTVLVKEFQTVLQASVTSFEANKAAGNGTLGSIAGAAETNLTQWIAAAQFDNQVLAGRVQLAATSFLTVIESIAAVVGPGVVPPAPAATSMRMGGTFNVPARVKVKRATIVVQWNERVCAGASTACLVK